MSSIIAVVQQITETLTDSVSQLVLYVIVLQEQNANVPEQLPEASKLVAGASENLVTVAKTVGEANYTDYPDIKQKIVDAANVVEASKNGLLKAVEYLLSVKDRKLGWASLVEACKVIAGKTVLLLQIVYGAEVERLFRAAEQVAEAMNKLNSKDASKNAQKFADDASNAATQAKQVANYLLEKVQATESPILKEELTEIANNLDKMADDLIDKANHLLENPEDPSNQAAMDKAIEEIKREIERANQVLKGDDTNLYDPFTNNESLSPAATKISHQQALDAIVRAAKNGDSSGVEEAAKLLNKTNEALVSGVRNETNQGDDAQRKKEVDKITRELEKLVAEEISNCKNLATNPSNKSLDKKVDDTKAKIEDLVNKLTQPESERLAEKQVEVLDNLVQTAKNGDTQGVEALSKNLPGVQQKLADTFLKEVRESDDPYRKRQVLDGLDELEELLPQEIDAARAVANNPNDKDAVKKLEELNKQNKDILSDLTGPKAAQSQLARKEKEELAKLVESAKKSDFKGMSEAAKAVQDLQGQLANMAKKAATDDPIKRRQVEEILSELDTFIPNELIYAKEVLEKPNDPSAKDKLDQANEKNLNALNRLDPSNSEGNANNAKYILDKLFDAASKGDKPKTQEISKSLPRAIDEIKRIGENASLNSDNLLEKVRLRDAVHDLEVLTPEELSNANSLANNPKDKNNYDKLADSTQKLKDTIDAITGPKTEKGKLEDQINELNKNAQNGDKPATEETLKDIKDTVGNLLHQGKNEAKESNNPDRKKELENNIYQLEELLPQQSDAAKAVANNPNDKGAKEKLNDINEKILQAANEIANPENVRADTTNNLQAKLDKMVNEAKRGNPNEVDSISGSVPPSLSKVAELARNEAKKTNDPQKKERLNNAASELEKLLPQEVNAAKDVAKDPNNKDKKDKLDKLHDQVSDLLSQIAQPDSKSTVQALDNQLDKLIEDAKKGNQPEVENDAKSIFPTSKKLIEQVREEVKNMYDAERKKELLDAVGNVERLTPSEIGAAKEIATNPNNQDAKDKLDKIDNELRDALSTIGGPKADLSKTARELEKKLNDLIKDSKNGEKSSIEADTRKIEELGNKLEKQAKAVAADTKDPKRRKDILKATEDLKNLLPDESKKAYNLAQNPSDAKNEKALEDADEKTRLAMNQLFHPEGILGQVGKQFENQVDAMVHAAKNGDPEGTNEAANKVLNTTPHLLAHARDQANRTDDPVRKQRLFDAIDEMENLIPLAVDSSKQVAQNSSDKETQEELDKLTDQLKGTLHDIISPETEIEATSKNLADQLDEFVEVAKGGNTKDTNRLAEEIPKSLDQVIQQGKAEARDTNSPYRQKQLLEAINDLEKIVLVEIAQGKNVAAKPSDNKGKETLADLNEKAQDALDRLNAPPAVTTAKEASDLLDQIAKAAKGGDPRAVEKLAQDLKKTNDRLADETKNEATKLDDPTLRKQLNDAIEELANIIPRQIIAAKNVVENQGDKDAVKQLHNGNEDAKSTLSDIIFAAQPSPEAKIVGAVDKTKVNLEDVLDTGPEQKVDDLAKAIEKLNEETNRGDKPGTENILKDIKELVDGLKLDAKNEIKKSNDPNRKKELENNISQLEELLPQQSDAAKAVANNPNAKGAKEKLNDINEKILQAANEIANPENVRSDTANNLQDKLDKMVNEGKRGNPNEVDSISGSVHSPVSNLVDELVKDIDDFVDTVKKGDTNKTEALANKIPKTWEYLKKEAEKEAEKAPPRFKKTIRDAVNDLDKVIEPTVGFGRKLAKIPTDQKTKEDLDKNVDWLKDALSKLKRPDKFASDFAVKEAERAIDRLKDQTLGEKRRADDPKVKGNLNNALKDLSKAQNNLPKDYKNASLNPNDKKAENTLRDDINDIKNNADKILDNTKAEIIAKANQALHDADKVKSAANSENPQKLATNTKQLADDIEKLADLAKLEAEKEKDSKKKQVLKELVDDLLLNAKVTAVAANDLAKDPSNDEGKKELNKDVQKVKDLIEEIAFEVKPLAKNDKAALAKQKEFDAAKVVRSTQDKTPSLTQQLHDLDEKLKQAAENLKNNPNDPKAQKEFDELLKALDDTRKKLENSLQTTPEDHVAALVKVERDDLDKLEDSAKNGDTTQVLDAAKNLVDENKELIDKINQVIPNNPDPAKQEQLKNAVIELSTLIPEAIKASKGVLEAPQDSTKKDALNKILGDIDDVHAGILGVVKPSPEEQIVTQAAKEKEALKEALDAAKKGDRSGVETALRKAKDANEKLGQLTNDAKKRSNDQPLDEKLGKEIQAIVEAAKRGDIPKVEQLAQKIPKTFQNVSDRVKKDAEKVKPQDKKRMLKAVEELGQKLPSFINNARKLARTPNDNAAKVDLSQDADWLRNAREKLKKPTNFASPYAQNEAQIPGEIKKKLGDIYSNLNQGLPTVTEATKNLASNPSDVNAANDTQKVLEDLNKAVDNLVGTTNAEVVAQAKELENNLFRLKAAKRRADGLGLANNVRNLIPEIKKLNDQVKNNAPRIDDPQRKQELLDASNRVEPELTQVVNASKDVLVNPNSPEAQNKFKEATANLEATLAEIEAKANLSIDNEITKQAKDIEAVLATLPSTQAKGDKSGTEKALEKLNNAKNDLVDSAHQASERNDTPANKQKLEDAVRELQKDAENLNTDAKQSTANPSDSNAKQNMNFDAHNVHDDVRKLIDASKPDPVVNALVDSKKGAKLVAKMDKLRASNNTDELWRIGRDLSRLMGDMISNVNIAVQDQRNKKLSDKAREALELSDLISGLEDTVNAAPRPTNYIQDLDSAFDELAAFNKPKAAPEPVPSGGTTREAIPQMKTFEDNVQAVAEHIKKVSDRNQAVVHDDITGYTKTIALELAKISVAAKDGKRQEIIVGGRTVHANVMGLEKKVKELCTRTKDKQLVDRLFKSMEALHTFSTQLKILSAVKAAGGDKDSDDQLVSVARSFGYAISDLLSNVAEASIKNRRG